LNLHKSTLYIITFFLLIYNIFNIKNLQELLEREKKTRGVI
jgi:hypothetical protein